ncbi:MAG: peptidylprolyl isomerase [Planctomycetota bacterium]|jgi:parvulin-like peptidyl-prolyl isomerase
MRYSLAAAVVVFAAASGVCGPAPDGDEVICFVNGEPLLRETVDKLLEPVLKAGRMPPREVARLRQQKVQELVTDMLIDQFLKRERFVPTKNELDVEVERLKKVFEAKRHPRAPSFEETLKRSGMSVGTLKAMATPRMRLSCYVRRTLAERDILRTYETAKDSWSEVRARHILIGTRELKAKEEKEAARNKADDLRLRAISGEDFAKLAKESSDCPSGKRAGGDLGFFPRHGKMVEPFAAAAFALKKGGISPVVETKFGYHVIQTMEFRPPHDAPLDKVRDKVTEAAAVRLGLDIYTKMADAAEITVPKRKKQKK